MAATIISRADARALGLKRYFTGKPCKHGHVAERDTGGGGNCIECTRLWQIQYRQLPEVKKYTQEHSRASYLRNRDKVLAKCRERAKDGYNKRYYEANKEQFIEGVKKWIKANPERRNVYRQKRRAATQDRITVAEVAAIRAAQKNKCAICSRCLKKSGTHIDHIMPLSRGGVNVAANIQLTCPSCNHRKSNRDPVEFMQSLGRLL